MVYPNVLNILQSKAPAFSWFCCGPSEPAYSTRGSVGSSFDFRSDQVADHGVETELTRAEIEGPVDRGIHTGSLEGTVVQVREQDVAERTVVGDAVDHQTERRVDVERRVERRIEALALRDVHRLRTDRVVHLDVVVVEGHAQVAGNSLSNGEPITVPIGRSPPFPVAGSGCRAPRGTRTPDRPPARTAGWHRT